MVRVKRVIYKSKDKTGMFVRRRKQKNLASLLKKELSKIRRRINGTARKIEVLKRKEVFGTITNRQLKELSRLEKHLKVLYGQQRRILQKRR